jgi:hypothetical protein
VRALTEFERIERDGRDQIKLGKKPFPRLVKLISGLGIFLLGMSALPLPVFAKGFYSASSTEMKAGTLTLLAALGIGITVAVGAVIAFLQMTAKGKESNDLLQIAADNETFEDRLIENWNDEDTTPNSEYEDNPLTDYTIPITQLLTYPDRVVLANDGEPRLCGVEGEHAGTCYRILNRRLSFGRDPAQCVILFPNEAGEISRMHCTIRFVKESRLFILEDHGSSNGTFLANGERLEPGKQYELHSGQRFSLSGREHLFEVLDENEI